MRTAEGVGILDGESKVIAAMSQGRLRDDMSVVRRKLGIGVDVAEVYSPPRIVTVAEAAGLRGGFSLDLTVPYEGERWDFAKKSCRDKALDLVRRDKPYLLIGSPPCTAWSNLQNLNACRPGGRAKVDAAKQRARIHLVFCVRLYREQLRAGRYFLHEHPKLASSWAEDCVKSLAQDPTVMKTEIDQCAYGLLSKDKEGVGPAKKPTSFLTNSIGLVNALSKKCGGCARHVQLVEGRARAAQEYPRELCRAVTKGIIEQARLDAQDLFSIECSRCASSLDCIDNIEHDEGNEDGRCYWDDTSGEVGHEPDKGCES